MEKQTRTAQELFTRMMRDKMVRVKGEKGWHYIIAIRCTGRVDLCGTDHHVRENWDSNLIYW